MFELNTKKDFPVALQDRFLHAQRMAQRGEYADAVEQLRSLVREAPQFGKAFCQLGWIYDTKFQKYAEAEEFYKLALDHSPDYLPTYYHFAAFLSQRKKFKALENHLKIALALPETDRGILLNEKAIMYELRGEYSLAIQLYRESVRFILDKKEIEARLQAVERCQRKMNIFGGTRISDRS